jgi:membrane-bound serine protease (ClpP class)
LRIGRIFAALTLAAGALWAQPKVVVVDVDGVVHPITVEIISHAIDQAREEKAQMLLLRLDTPGGLSEATRQIIEKLSQCPVPVVTYVTPSGARAASAGFFLLEAGDVAAMSPGTNTGAASPVLLTGQMDDVMRKKVENDAAALLRSITSRRGRNSALAETTVREAKAFTEKEALDQKLIELIAADQQQLFSALEGREVTRWDGSKHILHLEGATVEEVPLTIRERLVSSIADPNIGFILMVLGALGIYVEFSSPGLIFPGIAGAILVLLGLSSLSILPINWVGVALLVLAVAMFVLEAKFTSHGILGVGATISMILGALLLVNGPPELRIHLVTALAVSIPFALITMFLVAIVVRARRNKVITGPTGMVGEIGVARTALEPEGQVLVRGEYWDAVAETQIPAGAQIRVKSVAGLKLRVDPL